MKFLKSFVIIYIILITICTGLKRPHVHKHFILEHPKFKLINFSQLPKDSQSVLMFKIGKVQTTISDISKISYTEEEKIYNEEKTVTQTANTSDSSIFDQDLQSLYGPKQSNIYNVQEVNRNYSNNSKAWSEMEKNFHELNNQYKNKNKEGKLEKISKNNNEGHSCPVCAGLEESEYGEEIIAWNKWRSNLQNRIMDDSEVDANYGTIFYFTFTVDKNRNISNIKVISTDFTNKEAIDAVRNAIINLKGKSILKFPKNTKRDSIKFSGGFVLSLESQYSTPSDFNDVERVRSFY